MSAMLTFSFPWNIDAAVAIKTVADHFGATVSINGGVPEVPQHIKLAVEGYDPSTGTEQSAAVAFGSLMNGAAGNVPATPASVPPSAGVATSTTAHAAQTAISATLPPATSDHAAANPATDAHAASAQHSNLAAIEFDSTGLAWDERIHSGNKTKTPAGEWRAKKGADKNQIKLIEMELRARYGSATQAAGMAPTAAPTDPAVKKAAALQYAHAEAIRVAGAQKIDDNTLALLLDNKPATLSPDQAEWFRVYVAKRGAAYTEFMNRPEVPQTPIGTVVDVAPEHLGAASSELDAAGLPHDARIHVAAKLKDPQGVWLQRFDVPAETKLAIMAEIRAQLAGNAAAAPSGIPTSPDGGTPVAPTPPAVPSLPVVTPAEAATSFPKLMQWIVGNKLAGRITDLQAADAAKSLGSVDADGNGTLAGLTQQGAFWPYVVQILQAQGAV